MKDVLTSEKRVVMWKEVVSTNASSIVNVEFFYGNGESNYITTLNYEFP